MKSRNHWIFCGLAVCGLALSTPAKAALVGYWNMNEGSGGTVADATGNGNTATITGLTWSSSGGGHSGATGDYALQDLTGTQSSGKTYVDIPMTTVSLTALPQVTLSGWTNITAGTNYGHILVTTSNYSSRDWIYQDGSYGGQQWISGKNYTGYSQPAGWTNFALTFDGSTAKFYLNGVLKDSWGSGNWPGDPSSHLLFGGWTAGNSSFGGSIDGLAIFNTALDSAGVLSIYNGTNADILAVVPEPTALSLLGLAGLGLLRRRR